MVTLQEEVSINMNQEEDPFAEYYGNIISISSASRELQFGVKTF